MTCTVRTTGVHNNATTHDIKNQLSIMLGFCELLARTLDEHDPRRTDVRHIETAGRTALALLGDTAYSGLEGNS